MRRLLQGDVGSGKSLVAACASLMTIESGFNVAVMAPTEILAEQLWSNFRRWFEPLGITVDLRTGNRKTDLELPLLSSASPGARRSERVVVGTHALVQESFQLERIGLVIIDEQHKFGVAQREALLRKGRNAREAPHLLVMTATPIPRTLGLTLYGDLDVSVLDELPAGRGQIRTHVREPEALPKVWGFVQQELARSRQAYVVYSRVTEAEQDEIKAVTKEFARVQAALAPHPVGLLHGQLPPEEKERVMAAFRGGTVKTLVTTSVIEVGVDVPNATVMLIENAEQFGLAQLHQLRGRIGRGGHDSHCILLARMKTEEAAARMKVMTETCNGFEIAEADLRLRGPGELVGRDQSGLPDFRFGHLAGDRDLVEAARDLARNHLRRSPSGPSSHPANHLSA
jgi:ATP-dependent DNA helicase RecG